MLSQSFYLGGYIVIILTSLISLTFSLLIIFIIVNNRQRHSVSNLLVCHTSGIISLYAFLFFWMSVYGIREGWPLKQTACTFRGYTFAALSSATCYSYVIQALSRLFFVIFSKYRFLLTYRVHYGLIAGTWLVSGVIPIEPFFYNGYQYEEESRLCLATSRQFHTSFYIIIMVFIIPLNIVIVIYGVIFNHIRHSTNRVSPFSQQNSNLHGKRELKVLLNIIIQLAVLSFCGIPFFILVIWHTQQEPPEWFYLISIVCISVGLSIMMIVSFFMNKTIREALSTRLRRHQTLMGGTTIHTLRH